MKYINIKDSVEKEKYLSNSKNIDYYHLVRSSLISYKFMEKHSNKIEWELVSIYQNLSEEFMEKHLNKLDIGLLIENQDMSDKFMEKIIYKMSRKHIKIYFEYISEHRKLSEKFVRKHIDELIIEKVLKKSDLSKKFKYEFSKDGIKRKRLKEKKKIIEKNHINSNDIVF